MFVQTANDVVQARPQAIQVLRLDVSQTAQVDRSFGHGSPGALQVTSNLSNGLFRHEEKESWPVGSTDQVVVEAEFDLSAADSRAGDAQELRLRHV
jgi:hypothetical protein